MFYDESAIIEIKNTDFWFKIVGMLQQNWASIEVNDSNLCEVIFFADNSGVFDYMTYDSVQEAERGLLRNGFVRYDEDKGAQEFIGKPKPPFHPYIHPNGDIYSSGRFWE
jgi:hypothetical protein